MWHFSAAANFVGSGVLRDNRDCHLDEKVKHRRELLFAALPARFSPFINSLRDSVWLGLDGIVSPAW